MDHIVTDVCKLRVILVVCAFKWGKIRPKIMRLRNGVGVTGRVRSGSAPGLAVVPFQGSNVPVTLVNVAVLGALSHLPMMSRRGLLSI